MSLSPPKSAADEDKTSPHHDVGDGETRFDSVAVTPKLKPKDDAPKNLNSINYNYLSAPRSGPIRPLSPDTISNLSADEFEQISPSRRPSDAVPSHRPTGLRGAFQRFWVRNKGLAYMILGNLFGTLMNVTTRLLEVEGNKGKGMHPFQILFARMGITFVLASGYMWWKSTPYFPFGLKEVRGLLLLRGVGGFFGVFGMYFSLLALPLADATVITFLAPGLACWACSILINEPFTRVERIAGLVSLAGVVLIARPTSLFTAFTGSGDTPSASGNGDVAASGNSTMSAPGDVDAGNYENVTPMERLTAVGIALIGVLGSATAFTTIRWIGKRAHPLMSVNYFALVCFIISITAQSVSKEIGFVLPATLKEWGYLLFLGICGFVMQFLLAAGLSYEKSSRATNMAYTQEIFALGFDRLIFGNTPGIMSIMGSSLILGSAIMVAVQTDPTKSQQGKEAAEPSNDEESRTGLMTGERSAESNERLPVQEVQLRTLR